MFMKINLVNYIRNYIQSSSENIYSDNSNSRSDQYSQEDENMDQDISMIIEDI